MKNDLFLLISYDPDYLFDDDCTYHVYQINDNSAFVQVREELSPSDLDPIVTQLISDECILDTFPSKTIVNIKLGDIYQSQPPDPIRDTIERIVEIEDIFDSLENKIDYDLPRIV